MKRVLMVSPHFPPDTSAGTHRVRLLAPHLTKYCWEPTVVSVDSRDYEGRLDPELLGLVPLSLRVVRSKALPYRWTRFIGIGDLGLRAFKGLLRTCSDLLRAEQFDLLFITIYPSYTALLGPILKRRFRIPFILDYQDPWVGAWGKTVGGGKHGKPNLKNRLARFIASQLEPRVARAADAITAVSAATYEAIQDRHPELKRTPCFAVPLGGEIADFDYLRFHPRSNNYFDPRDGKCHICYVGTLLPLGFETLEAFLSAVALLRLRHPTLFERLRLHFFGTSNQTAQSAPSRVLPLARDIGVDDCVNEIAPRVDYLDALTVLTQATAILMMGSSERHYTASKLYPGLLAERPILAIYHEASSVVQVLRSSTKPPTVRLVTYSEQSRAMSQVEAIYRELVALLEAPVYDPKLVNLDGLKNCSAETLAADLAAVFDHLQKLEAVINPQRK